MKFKLTENLNEDLGLSDYQRYIFVGPYSSLEYLMDFDEFKQYFRENFSTDELAEILIREGYITREDKEDEAFDLDSLIDDKLFEMSIYDYYDIPEFKDILDGIVFPIIDQAVEDQRDSEAEFPIGIHGEL